MSTRRQMDRPIVLSATLIVGLFAVPRIAAFADPGQPSQASAKQPRVAGVQPASLRGRVTDFKGKPLADVRVRVAIPKTDMRFVDSSTNHKLLTTKTDANGDYRLEIPTIKKSTTASLDAMKPGFQRLVGTLMSGGDERSVKLAPGVAATADLSLQPALYFAGKVVDEEGKPIAGVTIASDLVFANRSGGVERTASDSDGSFELFNYPEHPEAFANGKDATKGPVSFFHRDCVYFEIEDAYALLPHERGTLRIVLKTGLRVSGTVLDIAGKPVPHATVKATDPAGCSLKGTMTDEKGKFVVRGLTEGPVFLMIRALNMKQKARVPVLLYGNRNDLECRLHLMSMPEELTRYTVLGMQLADVTPELRSAYDLSDKRGALILDPGPNSERLDIGQVAEGYDFWLVGEERVGSVREFATKILDITAKQKAAVIAAKLDISIRRVRVVYSYSSLESEGTNTQYLKLANDDIEQLQGVLDQCAAADQKAILALGKLGAQFQFKPLKPASQPDHRSAGPEVSVIVLGNKWKGGDADLSLIATLPLESLYVRGSGKVSDKALDELRKARPDISVERVPEASLGAVFGFQAGGRTSRTRRKGRL
jgi:Carboxypeptidase regulatory-like domain